MDEPVIIWLIKLLLAHPNLRSHEPSKRIVSQWWASVWGLGIQNGWAMWLIQGWLTTNRLMAHPWLRVAHQNTMFINKLSHNYIWLIHNGWATWHIWWAISLAFWCHQSINLEIKIWQTIKLWLDLWHHWWCLCLWSHWWYLYLIYIWHHDLHDVMICKPHLDKGLKNISFVTPSIFGW